MLISGLSLVTGRVLGEEPGSATVRQRLHAKIKESVALAAPAKPSADRKEGEDAAGSVVVMKPFVVSESKGDRQVELAMAREEQKVKAERFTAVKGGTIYKGNRMEIGSWWAPGAGWSFLKISW